MSEEFNISNIIEMLNNLCINIDDEINNDYNDYYILIKDKYDDILNEDIENELKIYLNKVDDKIKEFSSTVSKKKSTKSKSKYKYLKYKLKYLSYNNTLKV